jgi:hypothetical protein
LSPPSPSDAEHPQGAKYQKGSGTWSSLTTYSRYVTGTRRLKFGNIQ